MAKLGQRDLEKEKYWRDTHDDWKRSGLSQARFCQHQGIKRSTFNSWIDVIRRRDKEPFGNKAGSAATPPATNNNQQPRRAPKRTTRTESDFDFVKLRLKDQPESVTQYSGAIEVRCPNGVSVSLPAQVDLNTLLAVLSTMRHWANHVL